MILVTDALTPHTDDEIGAIQAIHRILCQHQRYGGFGVPFFPDDRVNYLGPPPRQSPRMNKRTSGNVNER